MVSVLFTLQESSSQAQKRAAGDVLFLDDFEDRVDYVIVLLWFHETETDVFVT